MPEGTTPSFTGLKMHIDKKWRFSFWFPLEWNSYPLAKKRQGVAYGPIPGDPSTSFSVEVTPLDTVVTGDDLEPLYEGFIEGLHKLPELSILWQDKWVAGALTGLEAKYTFSDNGVIRKRWIRLMYEGKRQFLAVAQGATVEDYAYWEPMLFECMATIKID
jgi:hypothetical protein